MKKIFFLIISAVCMGTPLVAMEQTQTVIWNVPQVKTSIIAALQNTPVRNAIIAAITGATMPYLEKVHPVVTMLYLLHQLQQVQ